MREEYRFPRKFQIGFQEGTCPLRCNKCFAFSPKIGRVKKATKMSMENAKRLLDEIAELNNDSIIQPHMQTEPFANMDLKQIIRYCGEKNLTMSIITNGILLDKEWLDFIISQSEQRITMSFSLDAVSQETYEKVRGNYQLELIEERINFLLKNRKNTSLRIGVNFVIEEANKKEKEVFLEKWKYLADVVRIGTLISHDKKTCKLEGLKEQRGWVLECDSLNEIMTIDSDGSVRVCPMDAFGDTNLGNVFEERIEAIWNGPKMEGLRNNIKLNRLSNKEFCFGCEAYKHEGNFIHRVENEFEIAENGYQIHYNHR